MNSQDNREAEDQDVARLLRAAGRRPELPEALKESWEAQFRNELAAVTHERRRDRLRLLGGLCAGLAVVAVAIGLLLGQPTGPELIIRVANVAGGTLEQRDGTRLPLRAGHFLLEGSAVSTGPDGHIGISYRDYDLRLNSATEVAFADGRVELRGGEIYASSAAAAVTDDPLVIATPHGIIRDIGTQFVVALEGDRTVATVREGTIVLEQGEEEYLAQAQPERASRISTGADRRLSRESVPATGDDWRWIYRSSPAFKLDGSTAYEFLDWSVRESGLRLVFDSEAAEIRARVNQLHGDLPDLDPERAVAPVLAATDLVARREGNTLRVSLDDAR